MAAGLHMHNMAREIANHITARNPGGQAERLPLRGRVRHRQGHFKQVRLGAQRANPVFDHGYS